MWDSPSVISSNSNGTTPLKKGLSSNSDVVAADTDTESSLLPKELRKFERYRLDSFKSWPTTSGIDPKRLAKAGFFSKEKKDQVQCFACAGVLSDWKFGDVAIARHKENFPKCKFILGLSDNIPLNHVSQTNLKSNDKPKIIRNGTENNSPSHSIILNHSRDSSAARPESSGQNMVTLLPQRSSACDVSDGGFGNKFFGGGHASSSAAQVNFEKLKREDERLKTFKQGWSISFISPVDLAKAGFFYTLTQDKVQCAFCHGIVGHWDRGDNPLTEHARHFPMCPFLLNYNVGNVQTAPSGSSGNIRSVVKGYDVVGNYVMPSISRDAPQHKVMKDAHMKNNYEELGIISQQVKPRYPAQAVMDARLRSFNNADHPWPEDAPVSAEALAQAGFFYTGVNDSTRCFHCNGGLNNWVKGDEPWTEHARWFPKCNYVKLNKGDEFINECTQKFPPSVNFDQVPINVEAEGNAQLKLKVEDLMNSSVVTQVLEMGIPEQQIRSALHSQLSSTGTAFSTATELFDAAQNVGEGAANICSSPNVVLQAADISPTQREADCNASLNLPLPIKDFESENKTSLAALTLEEENRVLKEQKMCKVCMDKEIGVVFLPCGHLICCTQCAPALSDCPVCRKTIKGTVRTFLS